MNYKLLYDELHNNEYMHEGENGSYHFILKHIKKANLEYATVLDAGCSIGNGVKIFKDLGKDSTGMDVSEVAIKAAVARGLKAKQGSVLNMPFEDNSFDLVSSADMLEHLVQSDIPGAINELFRVTKKVSCIKVIYNS